MDDGELGLLTTGANGFSSSLISRLLSLGRIGMGIGLLMGIDGVSGIDEVEGKKDGPVRERFFVTASVDGLYAGIDRGGCGPP